MLNLNAVDWITLFDIRNVEVSILYPLALIVLICMCILIMRDAKNKKILYIEKSV